MEQRAADVPVQDDGRGIVAKDVDVGNEFATRNHASGPERLPARWMRSWER